MLKNTEFQEIRKILGSDMQMKLYFRGKSSTHAVVIFP